MNFNLDNHDVYINFITLPFHFDILLCDYPIWYDKY